ncbi:MAG: DUF4954 family protein [Ferruginibacter sp.]|nr:DUF4954 family protein [Chitinophagaceae bacterium]
MNVIHEHPVGNLGYNFIEPKFIPKNKDEYYLRNIQNKSGLKYKKLTADQMEVLIHNRNTSDNWGNVLVSDKFDEMLVRNCKFFGLVRIGNLSPSYKEFHNLRMPVGLYNSTIISCDIGNNVCMENANYLSHYIIEDDVMIANVNELATTNYAKFGNGILKQDEDEKHRIWIEVCNENGGRSIIPFNGMLAGDAYMWSKYKDDELLMEKFKAFTHKLYDKKRGYYGVIGKRTVIKNCGILKDVWIGSDAYIKGANKIKNVTINSDAARKSQIGEGCELVNGIIGYGCRIFYGVKAVRFILAAHSQLKYGARLINSYLGNNSTISCCEVLNSLIFPAHEQHHNNSFLCASLLMGQSNMAAGATIGSNHNSRSPDGEIVAGRGFWPGLCVSLKHNSKFASFTIIAKGDFPSELNIPIPYSLVANDVTHNRIVVMPAYWFIYNIYALERNAWKYADRDNRTERLQKLEFDYLAPDTVNEIFDAIEILSKLKTGRDGSAVIKGWENSDREIQIVKIPQALKIFKELIYFYFGKLVLQHILTNNIKSFTALKKQLYAKVQRSTWLNIGGQLMTKTSVNKLKKNIKEGLISNWQQVHQYYIEQGNRYDNEKLQHAFNCYLELSNITGKQFNLARFKNVLTTSVSVKQWMCKGIYESREKDYTNPFRKMLYDSDEEMNSVLGKLEDNSFVQLQLASLEAMKSQVNEIFKTIKS